MEKTRDLNPLHMEILTQLTSSLATRLRAVEMKRYAIFLRSRGRLIRLTSSNVYAATDTIDSMTGLATKRESYRNQEIQSKMQSELYIIIFIRFCVQIFKI